MSHSCTTDIVPFVAHGVYMVSSYDADPCRGGVPLWSPEAYAEGEWIEDFDEAEAFCERGMEEIFKDLEYQGWKYTPMRIPSKRNRLYETNCWTKVGTDFKVWLLNESQYCHVGEYFMSAVAESREAIEEFLRDFGPSERTIEETDTVEEWG